LLFGKLAIKEVQWAPAEPSQENFSIVVLFFEEVRVNIDVCFVITAVDGE
jgi:hypothetical protein